MDLRIEISGERAVCKQDGSEIASTPVREFVAAVAERADCAPLTEAIPDGVRFLRRRGSGAVLVMEERPGVRTVKWLTGESKAPFGAGAVYRPARLSFPFVIVVAALRNGALTGHHQCFYRRSSLSGPEDELLLPNLYNVAEAYGQKCWLCLVNLRAPLGPLPWSQKVEAIRKHLWGAGFNRSSEMHEGMSYWQAEPADPRVASLAAWEKASQHDPYFALQVPWQPSGKTIGQVMEAMLAAVSPPGGLTTAAELVSLLNAKSAAARGAR
jgi:hypothetical protein